VWVQYFDGANKLLFGPRRVSDYKRPGFAPFLERLPNDVVLSREGQNRVAKEVARELVAEGLFEADAPTIAGIVVRALLRGGR
jgi:hypothetical protein